jgi:hypothetical protein
MTATILLLLALSFAFPSGTGSVVAWVIRRARR